MKENLQKIREKVCRKYKLESQSARFNKMFVDFFKFSISSDICVWSKSAVVAKKNHQRGNSRLSTKIKTFHDADSMEQGD